MRFSSLCRRLLPALAVILVLALPGVARAEAPHLMSNPTHGIAYSQTFSTSLSGTWSVSAGALPPGLALSNAGALTGTPTAVGSFTFTVKVVAPKSGGTKQYTLVVSHPVLAIAPQQLFAATPGIFYSQPISASGGAAPYTFAL